MSGRTPCINPCCRRTAPADKFPGEMICGKRFRALPAEVRNEHRGIWRQIRKWQRRITKTSDELKLQRMRGILGMWCHRLDANWSAIKAVVLNPEKPEGLDAILEELGL
ncbi:hypothetical protein EHS39_33000 [Ensifer sp. MPMI2T]|nr:hypothetical protein EHS39_33000 [Ensifer sp. MPMI2T]